MRNTLAAMLLFSSLVYSTLCCQGQNDNIRKYAGCIAFLLKGKQIICVFVKCTYSQEGNPNLQVFTTIFMKQGRRPVFCCFKIGWWNLINRRAEVRSSKVTSSVIPASPLWTQLYYRKWGFWMARSLYKFPGYVSRRIRPLMPRKCT